MDWHVLPFALIGVILWIIQNVRAQRPPEPPKPIGRVSLPTASQTARRPGNARGNRKNRSRESAQPRKPAVREAPPPLAPHAAASTARWKEPPAVVIQSVSPITANQAKDPAPSQPIAPPSTG